MEISIVSALHSPFRARTLKRINIIQDRFLSELAGILLYLSTSIPPYKDIKSSLVQLFIISIILNNIMI